MKNNNKTVQGKRSFQARRIISSHEEMIKAPASEIFLLACPVQELKWINGWQGQHELVYTESGVNETNCIFREYISGLILFDAPVTTTWITTLHDPEANRIQFLLMLEDIASITFDLDITDFGNGSSRCRWLFTFTALREEANKQEDEIVKEKLLAIQSSLGQALKHYCETGEMLGTNGS